MQNKHTRFMCIAGVFTALVFVVTAYLHIPTNNGYIHVGDGLIYLAACILPWPYAMAVGAGGALLADCLTGFAIWAPGSVVIKAATALLFTNKGKKMMSLAGCGISQRKEQYPDPHQYQRSCRADRRREGSP